MVGNKSGYSCALIVETVDLSVDQNNYVKNRGGNMLASFPTCLIENIKIFSMDYFIY